jgi:hypothetical protein
MNFSNDINVRKDKKESCLDKINKMLQKFDDKQEMAKKEVNITLRTLAMSRYNYQAFLLWPLHTSV